MSRQEYEDYGRPDRGGIYEQEREVEREVERDHDRERERWTEGARHRAPHPDSRSHTMRPEGNRSTAFIQKKPWYPNLRQSVIDSGHLFVESSKDFMVENVTPEEVAEIERNALLQSGSNSGESSSSDGEYDRLHYRFEADIADVPPRVLNPGPQTWWFDVALKSSGDDNSTVRSSIFHEVVAPGGQGSTYRALTLYRPQSDLHKSTQCVTKKILSSRRSVRPDIKDDTIKLITASANPSGKETKPEDIQFRWIHFQNPILNLEEFKQQVLRIPDLEEHDLTILWDLFERVKDNMERTYIYGKYLEEGAIRCDGKSPTESRAATFLAVPTFKLQSLETPSILKGQPKAFQSSDHPPRALMQTTINTASTIPEDKRQATFSSKLVPKNQAIHVAQTWILVINDDLLVTYSPSSLQEVAGPRIEFEDGKQDDSVTILVRTAFDEAFYFAAEKCKTWFEFQTELQKVYGVYKEKDAIIISSDGTTLNSQNWAAQLGSNRLKLFRLTVVTTVPPLPGHSYYSPGDPASYESRSRSRMHPGYVSSYPPPDSLTAYGSASHHYSPGYAHGYGAEYPYGYQTTHSMSPFVPVPVPTPASQPRHASRRSSHVDFEDKIVIGGSRSRRQRSGVGYPDGPAPAPAPPMPMQHTPGGSYVRGYDATSPYGHPPYQHGYPVRSGNIYPLSKSYTMPSDEKYSKAVVRYGEHPDPASSSHHTRHPDPKKTTVTEVADEADARAPFSLPSDSEDSGSPRRRSRRRYPLAITAPPIPGDRERRPYTKNLRDQSAEPTGTRHDEKRHLDSGPPTEDLSVDESDSESDIKSESKPDSGSDDEIDEKPEDEPQKGHYQPPKERRVAFVEGYSEPASVQPNIVPDHNSHSRLSPDGVSFSRQKATGGPTRYHRPGTRTSKRKEAINPPDQDSIFYYLPNERPTEKSKDKKQEEKESTATPPPKVLPVFQWPTNASVEAGVIEKKRLSRKRASSRGSRTSNPPKTMPTPEAEATDESYSMLKNILDDLHQKFEKSSSKRIRNAYLLCGSSNYVEVKKSLIEIEKTHSTSEASPQKTKTLDIIKMQKSIVDLFRKILSFFIPQNWMDGKLIERVWYSILQTMTVGFYDAPHVERLFTRSLTKLESIHRHTQVIMTGVAGDDKENPRYRIPSALVEAFQQFVEAILLTLVGIEYIKKNLTLKPNEKAPKKTVTQSIIDKKFDECKSKLREGKFQLMCMIYTGRTKDQTNYEEACTETIVSFILRDLICQPVCAVQGASSPLDIFKERLLNLDIEAKYRPQQRIIQDITYLGEEVSAFDKVRKAQSRVLWAADTLLHPKGSLDIEEPRSRHSISYSSPRNRMGGGIGHFLKEEEDGVDEYTRRSNNLHNFIVEALSLKEEDHGKAIMVFTIVTTVFLPLNFMTSFFGMNTTDIRNTDRDQKIFWTTAIPVTVVVVGFALSWAYIGDSVQDRLFGPYSFWNRLFKGRPSKRRVTKMSKAIEDNDYEEEEEEEDDDDDDEYRHLPKYESYARPRRRSYSRGTTPLPSYGHQSRGYHHHHQGSDDDIDARLDEQIREREREIEREGLRHRSHVVINGHDSDIHAQRPDRSDPPGYYGRSRDYDRDRSHSRSYAY